MNVEKLRAAARLLDPVRPDACAACGKPCDPGDRGECHECYDARAFTDPEGTLAQDDAWRADLAAAGPTCARAALVLADLLTARPADEWHDDDGTVLWWRLPVEEPPYVGSPLNSDWTEGYYTHWTPLAALGNNVRAAEEKLR